MKRTLPLVALAASLAASPAHADDYERWYEITMSGQRAGWMHTRQHSTDDWIETGTRLRLDVKRGDDFTISITMSGAFRETHDAKPIWMESVQSLGAGEIKQSYTFEDGEVLWVTTQGGQRAERRVPAPIGDWLTPAAADAFVQSRIDAGADEISVKTIDPSLGLEPITEIRRRLGEDQININGRAIDATRWALTQSVMPGVETTEYTDADGATLISTLNMGGIELVMTATTREAALAELDPPEMMVSTLVDAGGPIDSARISTTGVYTLSVPDAKLDMIPESGAQRVTRIDERTLRVEVDANQPLEATEPDRDTALGSSALIDPSDEAVVKLAHQAVAGAGPDPALRAEAMRRYVHRHVREKSLGVGFGSAGDTARSREGDCTEHAVLLAAMLRAEKIPARVVSGLIYVPRFVGQNHVFGYHMWTQALLEIDGTERWVDLDATLRSRPFDATHIALATSYLKDDEGPLAMGAIAALLGRLEVEVESVE